MKNTDADRVAQGLLGSASIPVQSKAHKFQHNKPLPLPKAPSSAKPLKKAQVIPQKKRDASFEQLHCIPNQKYPLIYLEALKQRHIASTGAKERWIATRNLKLISLQMQQWIYAKLHHQVRPANQEENTFHQLIEKREERHFQIDRIIKYLSHF